MSGVTHTFKTSVTVPGLPAMPADPAVVVTADSAVEYEVDVPAGTTVTMAIPTITKTDIYSMILNADKAALNVTTNDPSGQLFALAKNASVFWHNQLNVDLFPNPISTSTITEFIIANPGTVNAVFRCSFLLNIATT
jgi:hypothetical protein